jgi:antitoxin ParD1/3/4
MFGKDCQVCYSFFMAIVTMNISLNEDLKSFVDERVKKRGYSSYSEYVRDLVRKDEVEAVKERLRALIQEGLESGAGVPVGDGFFAHKKAALRKAAKKSS